MLVAALVSGACLACAPVQAGGCCDPAGHCKKISRACDDQHSAILAAQTSAIAMPVAILSVMPAPPAESSEPPLARAAERPPDLCLLFSTLRI